MKKNKVGLFFGTFNPVHVGHIILANHMLEYSDLDEVWMVVTPMSPHKTKDDILDNFDRYNMLQMAIEGYDRLRVSDIEFHLPTPNYTVNTLAHLEERFPNNAYHIIMGEDNLKSLHRWKNFEVLIANYPILVYPRISEGEVDEHIKKGIIRKPKPQGYTEFKAEIQLIDAPIVEISSSFIRKAIKEGKNVRPLLDYKVHEYIEDKGFYLK